MIIYPLFGALAQLVAHNTGSVGVRSSNLLCSTDPGSLINQGFQDFFVGSFCVFWPFLRKICEKMIFKQPAMPYISRLTADEILRKICEKSVNFKNIVH